VATYDIEFIRRIDGKAEAVALDVVRLVGDKIASVIAEANELFKKLAVVPRPDGYRIREVTAPSFTNSLMHLMPKDDHRMRSAPVQHGPATGVNGEHFGIICIKI
jgi:hypothetical protein